MTPVVIDTNVIVSSFYGGNPKRIIDLLKAEKIKLCISKDIINEYIKVLMRFKDIDDIEVNELVKLFSNSRIVIFTGSTPKLKVVVNDPDDDKFIECAVELGAEYIISGDKDLLSIKQFGNIKILSPKQFLEEFK
jgi:putative PIN family toxin of toxin-antitoxin system